jgi:hypothetical protein
MDGAGHALARCPPHVERAARNRTDRRDLRSSALIARGYRSLLSWLTCKDGYRVLPLTPTDYSPSTASVPRPQQAAEHGSPGFARPAKIGRRQNLN